MPVYSIAVCLLLALYLGRGHRGRCRAFAAFKAASIAFIFSRKCGAEVKCVELCF